ncbi:phosphoglycerol transferase MdoB-like AlkP superfamily enzyme [Ruminiclostridium sufflavum DSM 19573]|uniref:Phosphoglycerol transferase MdoB-like AlkP superfamily enzyme n=1 Tax=Ruminiclostridium sufflavum DSM 19573 TaxID=1121337 RepID=A0A318XIR6_9FIRM|nr:LTA synthase family protein [Ruminiclostridium sufflavum]PYG85010.1 phosphoglycerol transferase MdoB-like AlkP superfamily enzyme [Ruminiclostridium sufflavum DSM 19573]
MEIKKILSKYNCTKLLFFLIPIFSLFIIEFATRGDFISTVIWPVKAPLQFFLSLLLFLAAYIVLWAFINNKGVTALSFSVLCVLIAAIVGSKREILGVPLMPWDVMSSLNVAGLVGSMNLAQFNFLWNGIFVASVLILLAMVIGIFIYEKSALNLTFRIVSSIFCAVIIAVVFQTLPSIGVEESPTATCEQNGYIRGFIINAKLWADMDESSEVSSESDFQYKFTAGQAATEVKPNVIFIMSEAFWDATLLPNVKFSEDPVPNLHALQKEAVSGEMVSPTYGGLTCNVEFEIMTGLSLKYLPYQTTAYTTSIKKEIPSIPTYFKKLGYQTISVHPYEKAFFKRSSIYPLIGIDKFVTQSDMPDAVKKGEYISDDTFADYIISEYEKAEGPVFMYNISMQNHWPYTTENYYKDNKFKIQSTKSLDEESITALQNYAQGINDADKSLKKVIDYFRTVKEPTVVVFLGDHLPALTEQLGVYKKLGFIGEAVTDADLFKGIEGTNIENGKMLVDNQKILKTPYLIWFNYKTDMKAGKTLSSNYMGAYIMSEIGMEIPPFYNFLLDYSGKVPVNRHFLSVLSNGITYKDTPSKYKDYEYTYEKIQKDILFGEQENKELFSIK